MVYSLIKEANTDPYPSLELYLCHRVLRTAGARPGINSTTEDEVVTAVCAFPALTTLLACPAIHLEYGTDLCSKRHDGH